MNYLLFCGYFLLLLWLVIKTPFFKKMPVSAWVLAALFTIKVAAGLYYGWFFSKMPDYKVQADTWRMFYESLSETHWLKTDPAGFAADLFRPRYQQDSSILASGNSYWNDIKSVLMVKLMAVLNLLSGGRYYINVLFFEYLSFFGPVAVSRLFISSFPGKKWLVISGAFFFPSALLWCSGFHKEGLLVSALGLSAWLVKQLLVKKDRQWVHGLLLIFSLFIAFLLRNYLVAFFIAWSVAWAVAAYFPKSGNLIFPAMMVLLILFFFATSFLPGLPNLPQRLALRQHEFLQIPGESLLQPQPLQPSVRGYAAAFPQALANGFLQPLPTNIKKISYLPAALETVIFIGLLTAACFFRIKRKKSVDVQKWPAGTSALLCFSFFFAGSVFLLTGFTIPYLGAIVRYKSVAWPFILLPLLCMIPAFSLNIKKK